MTIALAHLADALGQFGHELIVHFVLEEQARTCAADLTLVEEDTGDGAFDGGINVSISEHDVRCFAAQLERDALEVAGRSLNNRFVRFVSPVKATLSMSM